MKNGSAQDLFKSLNLSTDLISPNRHAVPKEKRYYSNLKERPKSPLKLFNLSPNTHSR
jgi:hypothetical protein